ncbi:DUF4868 domain-containing protein [Staphylococcus saprophyticus]|nr:DUF4868 domain-containing protein [Staphylococcus saprophyticus]
MEKDINNIIANGDLSIFVGYKKPKSDSLYWLSHISIKNNNKGEEITNDFKQNHNNRVNSDIFALKLVEYNPIISQKDTVETINTSDINGYQELITKQSNIDSTDKLPIKSIKFFIFEYEHNGKIVYIFRRYFKKNQFDKSLLVKIGPEGIFDKVNSDESLNFDYDIDMLIYDEKCFVLNHISLERIFYLNEEFKEKANITLEKISETNKINNFDKIKNKLLNDGRFVRRIAKLSEDNNRSTLFIENINNTKNAIYEFDLSIIYDEELEVFEVDYNDEIQLNTLVNLMQDSYYKTLIGNEKGTDNFR